MFIARPTGTYSRKRTKLHTVLETITSIPEIQGWEYETQPTYNT
jgi:hypothetical protein